MHTGLTIFYTDDDQDDIEFFREIINIIDERLPVIIQENGMELLNALNNPPPQPSVVFLDINMPGMNGLETLQQIRKSEKHRQLPVVMFSTSGDEYTIKKSKELGASFYVQKSGVFERLKQSIEHTLNINWTTFNPNVDNFVYSR